MECLTTSGKEFFMLSPHGKKSKVDQNRSKRMTLDDTVPMGFFRVIRNITITEQNHIWSAKRRRIWSNIIYKNSIPIIEEYSTPWLNNEDCSSHYPRYFDESVSSHALVPAIRVDNSTTMYPSTANLYVAWRRIFKRYLTLLLQNGVYHHTTTRIVSM